MGEFTTSVLLCSTLANSSTLDSPLTVFNTISRAGSWVGIRTLVPLSRDSRPRVQAFQIPSREQVCGCLVEDWHRTMLGPCSLDLETDTLPNSPQSRLMAAIH